jgi:hypothetical protein
MCLDNLPYSDKRVVYNEYLKIKKAKMATEDTLEKRRNQTTYDFD